MTEVMTEYLAEMRQRRQDDEVEAAKTELDKKLEEEDKEENTEEEEEEKPKEEKPKEDDK